MLAEAEMEKDRYAIGFSHSDFSAMGHLWATIIFSWLRTEQKRAKLLRMMQRLFGTGAEALCSAPGAWATGKSS
jgi:hypothetical protein